MDEKLGKACIQLADIAFKFAATNRVTLWPDCETPESDTDHTVMLGLVACSVAHTYAPHLDVGKIAQFALVHDVVDWMNPDLLISDLPEHRALRQMLETLQAM